MPAKIDPIIKEKSCKQGAVTVNGAGNSKMILTLLIKVVIFYVGLTIVKVGEFSF